jgi:hypothetical protein
MFWFVFTLVVLKVVCLFVRLEYLYCYLVIILSSLLIVSVYVVLVYFL